MDDLGTPRVAVVGHNEWVTFVRVPQVPTNGTIVHAQEWWAGPGGGGSVAATQAARLAGRAWFFTALGDDRLGVSTRDALATLGVEVLASARPEPTRRAITHVEADGERSITVLGDRLAPRRSDELPWELLHGADAVYFTAGDVEALRAARSARVLVVSSRAGQVLAEAGVEIDVLVGSATDPDESYLPGSLTPEPRAVVMTEGADGGSVTTDGSDRRFAAVAPPGQIVDRYGAGDSFAAGLTVGLGAGMALDDALILGARCGAAAITGRGPSEGQLSERITSR